MSLASSVDTPKVSVDKGKKSVDTAKSSMDRSKKESIESVKEPAKVTITTYRMKPSLKETFKTAQIREIVNEILVDNLEGKVYDSEEAKVLSRNIADYVNNAIKEKIEMTRYKYVVQVMLGQHNNAGCRYLCKCCWDVESDSYTSNVYESPTMFCVCTVFGIYLY